MGDVFLIIECQCKSKANLTDLDGRKLTIRNTSWQRDLFPKRYSPTHQIGNWFYTFDKVTHRNLLERGSSFSTLQMTNSFWNARKCRLTGDQIALRKGFNFCVNRRTSKELRIFPSLTAEGSTSVQHPYIFRQWETRLQHRVVDGLLFVQWNTQRPVFGLYERLAPSFV